MLLNENKSEQTVSSKISVVYLIWILSSNLPYVVKKIQDIYETEKEEYSA